MTEATPAPTLPPAPSSAPASRGIRIALYASLALNLLFVGAIGGALLRDGPDGPRSGPREIGFGPFSEALTTEDRAALARAFMRDGGTPRQMRRELMRNFAELGQVLRTEPLDRAALEQVFATLKDAADARLEMGQRLLVERIVQMTPVERDRFADRIDEIAARGPMRGRGEDKPGP
jgi:uncharacterized membrane protein